MDRWIVCGSCFHVLRTQPVMTFERALDRIVFEFRKELRVIWIIIHMFRSTRRTASWLIILESVFVPFGPLARR